MEKPSGVPVDSKHAVIIEKEDIFPHPQHINRRFHVTPRAVVIVLSLLFIQTVWFACHSVSITNTVEERAYRILRENPLIGEDSTAAISEQ